MSLPRFEIVVQGNNAGKVWQEVAAAGASPMGMEAYQALRIGEVAPEYGGEMGEAYNPLETGLWGSISFTKGCYIGQEVIARLDTYQKVQKHLVSLSFSPNARVQEGAKLAQEGKEVGSVTSVVKLPTTGELMGLGYVRKGASEVGTQLSITEAEDAWAKVEAKPCPWGLESRRRRRRVMAGCPATCESGSNCPIESPVVSSLWYPEGVWVGWLEAEG